MIFHFLAALSRRAVAPSQAGSFAEGGSVAPRTMLNSRGAAAINNIEREALDPPRENFACVLEP